MRTRDSLNSDLFKEFENSELTRMYNVVGGATVETCRDYCTDTRTGHKDENGNVIASSLDEYIESPDDDQDCDI